MKLIYTHENRMLVSNLQNILHNAGVTVTLKNEYAAGASGDLAFLSTWPELWVLEEAEYPKAMKIINDVLNKNHKDDWLCNQCGEKNSSAFEWCWNCQNENSSPQPTL